MKKTNFLFFIIALFILVFPKGGIKWGDIPITWGYALLGIVFIFFSQMKREKILSYHLWAFSCTIPFFLISSLQIAFLGHQSSGFVLSHVVSFLFLPLLFFIFLSSYITSLEEKQISSFIKKAVFFVAAYGVFLFIYKIVTGHFFEIPLLTVNLQEMGTLEETKCIDRKDVFKLISTYNNGNLFGICTLMLYPLYQTLEKSFLKRSIVFLALLLTLSRTVWLGLIFSELLYSIFVIRPFKKSVWRCLWIVFSLSLVLLFLKIKLSIPWEFFSDMNFGGRRDQFSHFFSASFFSHTSFDGILEVIYMGMLRSFGWIGLLSFLVAILAPLKTLFFLRSQNPTFKALYLGLINYLFISFSDGAILYIPVMAIYWFIASWMLSLQKDGRFQYHTDCHSSKEEVLSP